VHASAQHRPGDPRQLVGERDDGDILVRPAKQGLRPLAQRIVARSDMWQRRPRAMDQHLAQILVASLADSEQLRLPTCRELSGNEPQPSCKVAAMLEGLSAADRRDYCGCRQNPEAWDRRKPLGVIAGLGGGGELRVEGRDPPIELGSLRASVGDEQRHARAQSPSFLLVHQLA